MAHRTVQKHLLGTYARTARKLALVGLMISLGGCDFLSSCSEDREAQEASFSIVSVNAKRPISSVPGESPDYVAIDLLTGELGESIDLQIEVRLIGRNVRTDSANVAVVGTIEGAEIRQASSNGEELSSSAGESRSTRLLNYRISLNEYYDISSAPIQFNVTASASGGDFFDDMSLTLPVEIVRSDYPPSLAPPAEVSAGHAHSLAVSADGQAWVWGSNESGQIDQLTRQPATTPVPVDIPQTVLTVSAGFSHSLAVTDNNQVYRWGEDAFGNQTAPELVADIADAAAAFAGNRASYVITTDNHLYSWGRNDFGILGTDESGSNAVPTLLPIDNVVKVAAGEKHVLALRENGDVWGWGDSQYGRLGDFYRSSVSAVRLPEQIVDVAGVVDIAVTSDMSFLVFDSGRAALFGRYHDLAEVGGPRDTESNFKYIEGVFDAVGVVASGFGGSVAFIRRATDGSIYYSVAGDNAAGQLTLSPVLNVSQATDTDLPTTPVLISMGTEHGLFLQRQNTCAAVWSWGSAADGRLGRATQDSSTPNIPFPLTALGAETCSILTVSTDNGGGLASTPGSIDCGASCTADFATGESVTLAVTQQAATFSGFGGQCSLDDGSFDTSAPLSLSMDGHRFCPATFNTPSANMPPVARLSLTPTSPVDLGTVVTFDGSASTDPDGNIIAWDWDLDGDTLPDASGEIINFTYQSAGYRAITLTVTDDGGLTSSANGIVDVVSDLSEPPVAAFTIAPSDTERVGTNFSFDASSSSDDVGIAGLSWDFNNDGSYEESGEVVSYAPSSPGDYDIRLRVTDTDGQFTDAIQTIHVLPPASGVQYRLTIVITGPGQVDVPSFAGPLPDSSCDGTDCYIDTDEGTELTIDANPFTGSAFAGWSTAECDSIPSTNRCTVTLDSDRTVTATFQ